MEAEVQGYLDELKIIKTQIRGAVRGLSEEAINWQPLPKDTNSIYAILTHLLGADDNWVKRVINRQSINRDREAEFRALGNLKDIMNRFEKVSKENENILSKLGSSQLGETRTIQIQQDERTVNVRWCILHVISHYALHLGHIQLTRQLWEQK